MTTTKEIFHLWANGRDAKSGNVRSEDGKLYSYAVCIARLLTTGEALFATHSWSLTTSIHTSKAREAASHREALFCDLPDRPAVHNMAEARQDIERLLVSADAPRIREATRAKLRAAALTAAEQANDYLHALPEAEQQNLYPIDTTNLEKVREQLEELRRIEQEAQQRQRDARAEEAKETLAEWRAGASVYLSGLYVLPAALRLAKQGIDKAGVIETSHGASIPVEDAKRLWPLISKVRGAGRALDFEQRATSEDAKARRRLGNYTLDRIEATGDIVVGCHKIAYNEIECLARELGLLA